MRDTDALCAQAEYVNAIGFALQNNVALSIEIGSSGSVQIALLQVPILVFFSAFSNHLCVAPRHHCSRAHATPRSRGYHSFTMVFPMLDVFAVVFSVVIVNYVGIEGRSNYFTGAGLIITWSILICAYYFVPGISPA